MGLSASEGKSLIETWKINIQNNLGIIIVLAIMFALSLVWMIYLTTWKNNTRYKNRVDKNLTIEMLGFIFPYIVSICTIKIDSFGILINIVLFAVIGIAFICSDRVYMSPTFLLLGYKLYTSGSAYVLTKLSLEQFNLALEDDLNGVNVRELSKNVYIMR